MCVGNDTPGLPPKERGTAGEAIGNRLSDPAPKVNEAALAQATVDLRNKYRASVLATSSGPVDHGLSQIHRTPQCARSLAPAPRRGAHHRTFTGGHDQ